MYNSPTDSPFPPKEFAVYLEWPEFHQQIFAHSFMKPEVIESTGIRLSLGPITVEKYLSDTEPIFLQSSKSNFIHIAIWQRCVRNDVPKHWKINSILSNLFADEINYKIGYTPITKDSHYATSWSPQERTRRRRFLGDMTMGIYNIKSLTKDEFMEAYIKSATWLRLDKTNRDLAALNFECDEKRDVKCIRYRCVYDNITGEVLAGLASIDSVEHKSSYYFIAFIAKNGIGKPVMTGIIDDWFQYAAERQFSTVQFGLFWKKGSPKNWHGFSDFKIKFGTKLIEYPPALIRFL